MFHGTSMTTSENVQDRFPIDLDDYHTTIFFVFLHVLIIAYILRSSHSECLNGNKPQGFE
jgi:hypothetical protein